MNATDRILLAGALLSMLILNLFELKMMHDLRTVQFASAKAQIASGELDKEMAEMLMRVDTNTRKGN